MSSRKKQQKTGPSSAPRKLRGDGNLSVVESNIDYGRPDEERAAFSRNRRLSVDATNWLRNNDPDMMDQPVITRTLIGDFSDYRRDRGDRGQH